MLKPFAHAVFAASLFAVGVQPAYSATWSYDFDGDLTNSFDQLFDSPSPSTVIQADGALQFHTGGVALEAFTEAFVFTPVQPTYSQSWSVQLQVSVPASLDTKSNPTDGDFYVGAGLGVFTRTEDGNLDEVFSIDLESSPPNGHLYWTGWSSFGADTDAGQNYRLTSDRSGYLDLRFDAASKVLSAYDPHGLLYSLDIDDAANDWGMRDDEAFTVAILFSGAGMSVAEGEALGMDHFSLSINAVPEPETYALMLIGIGLVGFLARWRGA